MHNKGTSRRGGIYEALFHWGMREVSGHTALGQEAANHQVQAWGRSSWLTLLTRRCSACSSVVICSFLLLHAIQLLPARQHIESSHPNSPCAAANHALQPAIIPGQHWSARVLCLRCAEHER